ncbi:class A beta-lactamase [Pseudonocardia sp. N23]|uniref:class A beta-lactamase n=1 Tax=Pseudonocardia sp. N23 TaxID=1987376 RepID=UPI000BFB8752|nr:class A beta-lactamase [Pseudonocardia sp. N23]GAY07600.1 beta-lactamase [Pseudonocardia sp. N23]
MSLTRRSLLLTGAASAGAFLVGCAAPPIATPPDPVVPLAPDPVPAVDALERRYTRRIGVHAVETRTGAAVAHRGTERFLMCSTVKALMAAFVLHMSTTDPGLLDRRVRVTRADVLAYAPITGTHVGSGMTVAELCRAAVTVSDNTAYNLLLRQTGGPGALTAFVRGLGDDVTRADRTETTLNTPDGELDTTTPAAMATTLRTLATTPALTPAARDRWLAWMRANTTGDAQIRAGVPAGWSVADKTGSGDGGTKNDVGILVPPSAAPIVLTVFTVPEHPDDGLGEQAVAATTRAAVDALTAAR